MVWSESPDNRNSSTTASAEAIAMGTKGRKNVKKPKKVQEKKSAGQSEQKPKK